MTKVRLEKYENANFSCDSTRCRAKMLKWLILRSQCTLVDRASLKFVKPRFNYFLIIIAVFWFHFSFYFSASIGPVQFIICGLLPEQIIKDTIVGPLSANKAPWCSVLFFGLMTLKFFCFSKFGELAIGHLFRLLFDLFEASFGCIGRIKLGRLVTFK